MILPLAAALLALAVLLGGRRASAIVQSTATPQNPIVFPPEAPRMQTPTPTPQRSFVWENLSGASTPFLTAFRDAEHRYALPPGLLSRVAYQESRYQPTAQSPAGAVGLMQFMPATAKELGVDPLDPFEAIDGAGRYLSQLFRQFGTWTQALAAYNWGPGNLSRKGFAQAPSETHRYVSAIAGDVGI